MHILTTSSTGLDDLVEPVDLRQPPGDVVIVSFTDSDLAGLAAAHAKDRGILPSLRLANLRDLAHPMSVDLWTDNLADSAKIVVLRLLGGLDWWRYGVERLGALARQKGFALAVLPGEDRDDPRLNEVSTLPPEELARLLACFRAGGVTNLNILLRRLARHAGYDLEAPDPAPLPLACAYRPGIGAVTLDELTAHLTPGQPVVPVIFYRSMLLANDVAPIDALAAALAAHGIAAAPLCVASLKEPASAAFLTEALAVLNPAVILTATAFAAGDMGAETVLDAPRVPVLQAIVATTQRAAWGPSPRGLGASDLAMHVVLPELDGRVLAGALSFKDRLGADPDLAFTALVNAPERDRIAMVAERMARLIRLQATPRDERRVMLVLPDYPGAEGRTGWAVGLDVPASILAVLADLKAAGYRVEGEPETARDLLDHLEASAVGKGDGETFNHLPLTAYRRLFAALPASARDAVVAAWGAPDEDPDIRDGAFCFRAATFGNITAALAPDRGRAADRRATYHDPALPPRHALIAFGFWLRETLDLHALIHMGAHGTLEWLPGKAVALSKACFPEIVTGALPVIYPFIVSNPGEAAQAKRRIAGVTLGHLPPPLIEAGLNGPLRELERLTDEYATADGLDRNRRDRLARLIVEHARTSGLATEAGVTLDDPDAALVAIDAWLCDLKEMMVKDGQRIYGRSSEADLADPERAACAAAERDALLAALDGKRVPAGPAGAPQRGRRDVMPTGRNLFTADPRALPTQTAMDLARLAADEILRQHMQEHGEFPRALVMDIWGSATLRTGGEEIAQGLALMGCRPVWDAATGRVTGIEAQPLALLGRPRVDVTFRVSGLFRDLFPAQIALMDAAARTIAALDEEAADNPLAAACRAGGLPKRIYSTAPGAYGAGIEDLLAHGGWTGRAAIGRAYLDATSHAYGGADGAPDHAPGAFAARIADADLLVHAGDDPGRDLLEGGEDVAFIGGFAAAAEMLGKTAAIVSLDTTRPDKPVARALGKALARVVRSRAANPRFIAGQMRHGPRGAAELAEAVDRLVAFAETTGEVNGSMLDLLHQAYLVDGEVRAFLLRENPAAARAMARRFMDARRRGLWHPRRNDLDHDLDIFLREAGG